MPDLRRPAARPLAAVRRRGALGDPPHRAHPRVPGPLPRAGRGAVADRRRRPRGPARRPSSWRASSADGVVELVIATNPTMSGEATALYLADLVRGRVRVTRLASGLPVGADLEHADELTLGPGAPGPARAVTRRLMVGDQRVGRRLRRGDRRAPPLDRRLLARHPCDRAGRRRADAGRVRLPPAGAGGRGASSASGRRCEEYDGFTYLVAFGAAPSGRPRTGSSRSTASTPSTTWSRCTATRRRRSTRPGAAATRGRSCSRTLRSLLYHVLDALVDRLLPGDGRHRRAHRRRRDAARGQRRPAT